MKILYIDDDATNRAVLRAMLSQAGVVMSEAADARSGLQMIAESDYKVILMDLRMPQVSGLTAIRQLRSRTDGKNATPVIVVTADLTAGVKDLCRGAGADDFVSKPIDRDRLFAAIGSVLAAAGTVHIS